MLKALLTFYRDEIVATHIDIGRHVKDKRGKPALMLSQIIAVHIDVRHGKRAVEFEKELAVGEAGVSRVMKPIPANAAIVIISAILSVKIVPYAANPRLVHVESSKAVFCASAVSCRRNFQPASSTVSVR